jgi:hypothetical protein
MLNQAQAISEVLPFASTDEARTHMHCPAVHADHVVATDGHTMGVCRYDGVRQDDPRAHDSKKALRDPPPWTGVLPAALKHAGELAAPERLGHMPAKWVVRVTFRPNGSATLSAEIPARTGARGKVLRQKIVMVHGDRLDGFEGVRPREAIGVDGHYLERAVAFVGRGMFRTVQVYTAGPLDPIILVGGVASLKTRDDLIACDRFAIVMPMRI